MADNLLFQASPVHGILNGHIILHLSFTREVLPIFCNVMYIVRGLLLIFTLSSTSLSSHPLLGAHVFLSPGHTISRTQLSRLYALGRGWGFNVRSAPNRQDVGGFWAQKLVDTTVNMEGPQISPRTDNTHSAHEVMMLKLMTQLV
jgi:hypothetical protein